MVPRFRFVVKHQAQWYDESGINHRSPQEEPVWLSREVRGKVETASLEGVLRMADRHPGKMGGAPATGRVLYPHRLEQASNPRRTVSVPSRLPEPAPSRQEEPVPQEHAGVPESLFREG